jgi:hypothetical protein
MDKLHENNKAKYIRKEYLPTLKVESIYSHLNQDGENKSFHPSCCYRSPIHQVNEAADIKYVMYGHRDIV